MKLKFFSTIAISALLTLPIHSQVYLDSTEVANILNPRQFAAKPLNDNLIGEDDEDADSIITPFQTDSHLSWQENIRQRLDAIMKSSLLESVQASVMVWDLTDDRSLYQFRQKLQLRPASTQKCITAIAALDKLGPDYNFTTRIYYTGTINDSTKVLEGDLYCQGGMDPMFSSSDMVSIARAVRDLGIRRIKGKIYADLSFKERGLLGEGWCWDDKNPTLTPLLVDRKGNFIEQFLRQLQAVGVSVENGFEESAVPLDATLLTTRTHSMNQVLRHMLKVSDNLYAEALFYQMAASTGNHWVTAKQGKAIVNSLYKKVGLNPQNYNVADGSGLSLYNYASTELLTQLLRYAYHQKSIYEPLLASLPIAGVDGTLKKRMRSTPAAGNVRAKTGTLMGVISLAGYLTASNGHQLCFAIINNGGLYKPAMRNFQNKICVALSQ